MRIAGLTLLMLAFIALSACGEAKPDHGSGMEPGPLTDPPPANEVEQQPDPNAWRAITTETPTGWHELNRYGLDEVTGLLPARTSGLTLMRGVSTPRNPGATAAEESWREWRAQVAAGMLYHVTKPDLSPRQALDRFGELLVPGFQAGAVTESDGLLYSVVDGGRYTVAALRNKNGVYVVIGFAVDASRAEESGVKTLEWARSVKPE